MEPGLMRCTMTIPNSVPREQPTILLCILWLLIVDGSTSTSGAQTDKNHLPCYSFLNWKVYDNADVYVIRGGKKVRMTRTQDISDFDMATGGSALALRR